MARNRPNGYVNRLFTSRLINRTVLELKPVVSYAIDKFRNDPVDTPGAFSQNDTVAIVV